MSDLQKRLQMSRLPPMPPKGIGGKVSNPTSGKKGFGRGKRDYTPVSWDNYFKHMEDVKVQDNCFRIYESGDSGPVCFFLHGGGFSALSWAILSKQLVESVTCRCAAMDFRGHGDTYTDDDTDLSAQTLTNDVAEVIKALYGDTAPPIILIGHSLGGAIAVSVAYNNLVPSLVGLSVIDVVEGTALDALTNMRTFLLGRPPIFKSLEYAIEWSVRSGHIRNLESAKVSMVGQLKKKTSNETATSEMSHHHEEQASVTGINTIQEEDKTDTPPVATTDTIAEEEVTDNPSLQQNHNFKQPEAAATEPYTWRIDLTKTEPYWRGWFEGLSERFLSCNVPKMLLLAGVDRLDRQLTVGQMQGKFQMQVLPQSGHAVHEDVPDKVSDLLATFMVRHKVAEEKQGFHRMFPSC